MTEIMGGSISGKRSTGRRVREAIPSTTTARNTMMVVTGRSTASLGKFICDYADQSCVSVSGGVDPAVDLCSVNQSLLAPDDHVLTGYDTFTDLDLVVQKILHRDHLAHRNAILVHQKQDILCIGTCSSQQRFPRYKEALIGLCLDSYPGEHPRTQTHVVIADQYLHSE